MNVQADIRDAAFTIRASPYKNGIKEQHPHHGLASYLALPTCYSLTRRRRAATSFMAAWLLSGYGKLRAGEHRITPRPAAGGSRLSRLAMRNAPHAPHVTRHLPPLPGRPGAPKGAPSGRRRACHSLLVAAAGRALPSPPLVSPGRTNARIFLKSLAGMAR
eukprot:8763149-Pyramimonas_sp.AAC.1